MDDFPIDACAKLRESISGIPSPPVYWKVKVNRWRGAVYEDADGQAWLIAAGTRTAGSRKDFYKQFMSLSKHADMSTFYPRYKTRLWKRASWPKTTSLSGSLK